MKTILALSVLLAFTGTGCNSKAHDQGLANAIVSAQAAQAQKAALADAIDALHSAEHMQWVDQQPYSLKADSALCDDTPDECARQAFLKATDDRFAIARARINCIDLGGTHDECE